MSIPGPDDVTRVELPNGIVVLARPNFSSQSVVVRGALQVGALCEPREKLGLSQFTAAALMRGTRRFTFDALFEKLESNGASLAFRGHKHTTGFSGQALAEDLPLLLEVFNEAVRFPTFPQDELEKLRAQWLTSLAIRAQDTGEMAALEFDRLLYGDHPYALPDEGFPETVQAITREDVADFHRRCYGARGMIIVVVGALEPQEAIDHVAAVLGDWENPDQPPPPQLPPFTPPNEPLRGDVFIPEKSQCDIVMGSAGPSRRSPDYLPAMLGNTILGRFGMMGRVGKSVREKAGLAYYAYSELQGGYGPAPWVVNAGVAPQNVERAVELIESEIRRFVSEPVTEDELAESKDGIVGSLPLSFERNSGVANALLTIERYGLGLDYYRKFADAVRAITAEQILETARRYLQPDRLVTAVAGSHAKA